jgi:hypothetical protein
MKKQQADERVSVDLPIRFVYEDPKSRRKICAEGRVNDISINGMKIDLPLSSEILENNPIDFDLDLPNPFQQIKGQGEIRWKRWNQEKGCTTCGLKLEPLTLKQLVDLDTIVTEVLADEQKKPQLEKNKT